MYHNRRTQQTPKTGSDAPAVLRITIPTGQKLARSGHYVEQLSTSRLQPQLSCGGNTVRLTLAGQSLSVPATVYEAKAGETLSTVRPGQRAHHQKVAADSLVVDIPLPRNSVLAKAASALSGKTLAADMSFIDCGCQRRTALGGEYDGADVFQTDFGGLDGIALGNHHGEPCQAVVI
jgi:hypothetical protein